MWMSCTRHVSYRENEFDTKAEKKCTQDSNRGEICG